MNNWSDNKLTVVGNNSEEYSSLRSTKALIDTTTGTKLLSLKKKTHNYSDHVDRCLTSLLNDDHYQTH